MTRAEVIARVQAELDDWLPGGDGPVTSEQVETLGDTLDDAVRSLVEELVEAEG